MLVRSLGGEDLLEEEMAASIPGGLPDSGVGLRLLDLCIGRWVLTTVPPGEPLCTSAPVY